MSLSRRPRAGQRCERFVKTTTIKKPSRKAGLPGPPNEEARGDTLCTEHEATKLSQRKKVSKDAPKHPNRKRFGALFLTGNRAGFRPFLCIFLCGFLLFFSRVFVLFFLPCFGCKKKCPAVFMPVAFFEDSITDPTFVIRFWTFVSTRFGCKVARVSTTFLSRFSCFFCYRFRTHFGTDFVNKTNPIWTQKWYQNLNFPALWRISHRFSRVCLFT